MAEPTKETRRLTKEDRRRGLEFANRVAELAALAPDTFAKSRIYSAVNDLRKLYGFSEVEKRKLVMICLRQGCSTYADIVNETGFPRPLVVALVGELASADPPLVRLTPLPGVTKPTLHITLLKEPSGVLYP